MFKFQIALLALGCTLSLPGLCGVGQQSSSVDSTTTPTSTDEPSIANQPVPTTTGTPVPGTTVTATTTGTTVQTGAATGTQPGAPGTQPGATNGANAANPQTAAPAVPITPVEMVSRQTVLKPAGSQSSDQQPTSWQAPATRPTKQPTPRPARIAADADGSTVNAAPTVASTAPTGGGQVAAAGSGRGGASKDPVLGTANIAKAGSADVSNGYTFFVGVLIAGAILAFALFTYLRANSEEAKNRSR